MDKAVDCFISWRRCDGGHEQAGISKRHTANAGSGKARPCPLRIVATRGYSSWLRRKKDRSPACGDSARRISIPRTNLAAKWRMAIRASLSFDREERPAGRAPRFRKFSEDISKRDANDCRGGTVTWQTSRTGARTKDR